MRLNIHHFGSTCEKQKEPLFNALSFSYTSGEIWLQRDSFLSQHSSSPNKEQLPPYFSFKENLTWKSVCSSANEKTVYFIDGRFVRKAMRTPFFRHNKHKQSLLFID